MAYSAEQLNFYRICHIVTDLLASGLRMIFKQEWDNRYKVTLGEWKDSTENGRDFLSMESERSRQRNGGILKTIVRGDRAEWDCTTLFYALLYSDPIQDLNTKVYSNVKSLRRFRNAQFSHVQRGYVSDLDFGNAIAEFENLFKALSLDTKSIQELKQQTSFPTEELRRVLEKVDDLRLQREEKEKLLSSVEEQRKSLESQLLCDVSSFCVLPALPSHDVSPREQEVTKIMKRLKELKRANENALTMLYMSGNPGSGKSQLAHLVAKRFYEEVSEWSHAPLFVMTLNAVRSGELLASYIHFARYCKCPEYALTTIMSSEDLSTEKKISNIQTLISAKIERFTSWLLVVDNVTDNTHDHVHLQIAGAQQWTRGQILVTTWDAACIPLTCSFIEHISVSHGMNPVDARLLLEQLSGIVDHETEGEVAKRLDFQPLALASAAIYVRELRRVKRFTWIDYLTKLDGGLRASTEAILSQRNPSYSKSMTRAVEGALEAMKSDKIINHAFIFLSMCAPQPLKLNVIVNYIMNVCAECDDEDQIALKMKRNSLLLFEEKENGIYVRVHQVVHEVMKGDEKPPLVGHLGEALRAFCQCVGDSPVDDLLKNVPHLEAIITQISSLNLDFQNVTLAIPHSMITNCGKLCESQGKMVSAKRYFQLALAPTFTKDEMDEAKIKSLIASVDVHLGDLNEALSYYESALSIFSKVLGPQHLEVATACSCIGSVLQKMNDPQKGLDYFMRALKIRQDALGPEHAEVARSYSDLGTLFCAMPDLTQAKDYHEYALEIYQKRFGPDHVNVATSFKELGNVCRATGDLGKAREYLQLALAIRLKTFGPEDVGVATCYNDLGLVHFERGDLELAKEHYDRAISVFYSKLGRDHIYCATMNGNLGLLHSAMGKLYEAKEFYKLAYDSFLSLKGPKHLSVTNSARALAKVNCDLGDLQEAKLLYQRVLDNYQKVTGPEDTDVAETYYNLGFVNSELGEFEQARECYERALDLRLKKLGPEHIDVATIYSSFGLLLHDMGDLETAKMHFERALDTYRKTLDLENPKIASSYNNMGVLFRTTGDMEKAKEFHLKALAIRRKNFGNDSVQVATTLNDMGLVHTKQGDLDQAKECYKCALSIYRAKLGSDHLQVAHVSSNLGSLFSELGDLPKARECYELASDLYLKKLGPINDCVASSYNDLSRVYHEMGDLPQAKIYCEKALATWRKEKN